MNHKITEEEKQIRKERVLYIYFKLKEKNPKVFIESFIKKQGITSESTARRIFTDVSDWKRSEIDLFLVTYTPTKGDSEAIDDVLGLNASKVSNEVAEEPVREDKEADSIYQDGQVIDFDGKKIKFVYTGTTSIDECYKCCLEDECCDCMDSRGYWIDAEIKEEVTEEQTETLDEIVSKNEELQKELHTQKVVIETLQKGVDELNEAITESKIMIAEIAKERDDKDEEIRLLGLELQKYKNDLNSVLDDMRKLECLLSDNANENKNVLNNNNNKDWNNKHYDNFYNLTKQDIEKGKIKIDPYFVGKQWSIGANDNSGILAHQLKTIARFGVKNSVEREIKAIYNQAKRMMELYNIQEEN